MDEDFNRRMKLLFDQNREVKRNISSILKDIEVRKAYLDLGYPNMAAYLVNGVKISPDHFLDPAE